MRRRNRFGFALLTFTFLMLAIVTPFWQVEQMSMDFVLHEQYIPILYVVDGFGSAPYQYRPLAYYQAAVAAIVAHQNGLHYAIGFIVLRILQNLVIFVSFWAYWRAWKMTTVGAVMCLSLLLFAMSNALFDSNLAFDTYGDLMWYGVGCWAILTRRDRLVPFITVFAAATRETSIFIPAFHVVAAWEEQKRRPYAILSSVAWVLVYGVLRLHYGPSAEAGAYDTTPGLEMIALNISRGFHTLLYLLATYTLIPALLVMRWRALPPLLRRWSLVILPAWGALMLWFGMWIETRLFLVPFAAVVIPAAYFALRPTEPATLTRTQPNG